MQEDFREQVEDWEEFLAQLRSSSAYQEAYWEAVSEVAAALLTEISRQPDTDK